MDEDHRSFRVQYTDHIVYKLFSKDKVAYNVSFWLVGASKEQAALIKTWLITKEEVVTPYEPYTNDFIYGDLRLPGGKLPFSYKNLGSRLVMLRKKKFSLRFVCVTDEWPTSNHRTILEQKPGLLAASSGVFFCFSGGDEGKVSDFADGVEHLCHGYEKHVKTFGKTDPLTAMSIIYLGPSLPDNVRDKFCSISVESPSKRILWERLRDKRAALRDLDPEAPLSGPLQVSSTIPCVYTPGAGDSGIQILRSMLEQFMARIDLCQWIGQTISATGALRNLPAERQNSKAGEKEDSGEEKKKCFIQ